MRTLRKKFKAPVVVGSLLLAALVVVLIYRSLQFHVVRTEPTLDNVAALAPFLKVEFNDKLSANGLAVTSTNSITSSASVSGRTLSIYLKEPLQVNRRYTITIKSISSDSGSKITNKNLTFIARNVSFNSLPADQQRALIGKQDRFSPVQKDPILQYLPYSTLDFSLDSSFVAGGANNQQQLILEAQLLLAPGVAGAEANADVAQYKQEVLEYITSLGLDPAKYTIQYTVVNESLSGA